MLEPLVVVLVFAAGVLLGVGARSYLAGGRAREREASLQRELDEARGGHAVYREQVAAHFDQTAELFRDLTHQHAALYRHLAGGARELVPRSDRLDGEPRPRLPSPDPWAALLSAASDPAADESLEIASTTDDGDPAATPREAPLDAAARGAGDPGASATSLREPDDVGTRPLAGEAQVTPGATCGTGAGVPINVASSTDVESSTNVASSTDVASSTKVAVASRSAPVADRASPGVPAATSSAEVAPAARGVPLPKAVAGASSAELAADEAGARVTALASPPASPPGASTTRATSSASATGGAPPARPSPTDRAEADVDRAP